MPKLWRRILGTALCFSWLGLGTAGAANMETVPERYVDMDARITQSGPTLLFSDSPETVYNTGILYTDVVQGETRVFVHHVNGTKRPLKLAVLLGPVKALHGKKMQFSLRRYGFAEPDEDYYTAAPLSQRRYFKRQDEQTEELRFYDYRELLTRSRDKNAGWVLQPQQLVTGMCDFYVSEPTRVTVMLCPVGSNIREFARTAKILPMDEHPLRGTFEHADLNLELPKMDLTRGDTYGLLLASGSQGQYLRGVDKTTGHEVENYGNYGVVYHVNYAIEPGVDYELSVNNWGGIYAGTARLDLAGKDRGQGKLYAWAEGRALDATGEQRYVFARMGKEEAQADLVWSPPGAANLPIRIFWQKR